MESIPLQIGYAKKTQLLPDQEAIELVDETLQRFASCMSECFEIPQADLELIKET